MKTISPFELQMLIDKGGVEVIDVRSKCEFAKVHALPTRSVPLSELQPHRFAAHRKLHRNAPLYIICGNEMRASLAACALAGVGLHDVIAVEGGIEAWGGECLPVARKKSWEIPTALRSLAHSGIRELAEVIGPLFHRDQTTAVNHWNSPRALENI